MAINRSRIIILIATVAFLAISASATEHIVGGDKGWTYGFDYITWSFKQEYYVGDKLIFKYPPGKHNVFEVDEGAMEACVIPSPDKAIGTSGKDVITLETAGHKFYISGKKNDKGKYDCQEEGRMRFYINVLPRLVHGSDPVPSTGKQYVVGDDKGWTVGVDYQAWANGKKFNIGDKLIFKYPKDKHNVFQTIDDTAFRECTIPPAQEALTSGYDAIAIEAPDTWFICGVGNHCQNGQKLYIHASDSGSKSPGFKGGRKLVPTKL